MIRGQTRYTLAIDCQLDLLRYYSSDAAKVFFRNANRLGVRHSEKLPGWDELAQTHGNALRAFTETLLQLATPIYVAPHICHMLEDAVDSFPGTIAVTPQDFPSHYGFVFLDSEWEIGETVAGSIDYMTGFGWAVQPERSDSVHLLIFGPNRVPGHPTKADHTNQMNDYDLWAMNQPYDLVKEMETLADEKELIEWRFVNQFGELETKQIDVATAAVKKYLTITRQRKLVYSVLQFMRQKIVSTIPRQMPRAHRRHLPKAYRGDDVIQIITLRGYEEYLHPYELASHHAEHGDREWKNRWVVRGHWRKQWYASEQTHKPIWIDAYIKGPDGLPVKNATKLFAVTR